MHECVRAGCRQPALTDWWQLCLDCSLPLLATVGPVETGVDDQKASAGWDALTWAERISPAHWGNAAEDDRWTSAVRVLVVASLVTGRSSGCAHTLSGSAAVPVVAVVRAAGVLRCPPCAEPVVAGASGDGLPCDRCGRVRVSLADRVAAVTGSSLIVVGQLCWDCRHQTLALSDVAAEAEQ